MWMELVAADSTGSADPVGPNLAVGECTDPLRKVCGNGRGRYLY